MNTALDQFRVKKALVVEDQPDLLCSCPETEEVGVFRHIGQ